MEHCSTTLYGGAWQHLSGMHTGGLTETSPVLSLGSAKARMALRMPWWTLQQGYETTLQLAQIPGTPREVFRALNGIRPFSTQHIQQQRPTHYGGVQYLGPNARGPAHPRL